MLYLVINRNGLYPISVVDAKNEGCARITIAQYWKDKLDREDPGSDRNSCLRDFTKWRAEPTRIIYEKHIFREDSPQDSQLPWNENQN